MPRPVRCRRIERMPEYRSFSPDDVEVTESVRMTIDEYEALRLLDEQGLTQEACAARMNISRTTVTSIYDTARKKIAEALVHGKRLLITGGCCEFEQVEAPEGIPDKGSMAERIAVTCQSGEVFLHFGRTPQFSLFDVEEGEIVRTLTVDTNGISHGALAGLLTALNTDVLICGRIGMGARMALADAGIRVCAGAQGSVDAAAEAYVEKRLDDDPGASC